MREAQDIRTKAVYDVSIRIDGTLEFEEPVSYHIINDAIISCIGLNADILKQNGMQIWIGRPMLIEHVNIEPKIFDERPS